MYDRYGAFGLYLIDHVDENELNSFIALQNPCFQVIILINFFVHF